MKKPLAPICAQKSHSMEKFGHRWEDPYFWLKEKENPEVRSYVEAENAYAKDVMQPFEKLQKELFEEMKSRLEPVETGVPYPKGDYEYSYLIPEGAQYRVLWRRARTSGSPQETILDLNELARGSKYFSLGTFEVSPDQRLLAFATDTDGSEHYLLKFKNLVTGEVFAEGIPHGAGPVAWTPDSRFIYYVKRAPNDRPYQVWLHELGTPAVSDRLIFEEADSKFFVGVELTKDKRFVIILSESKITGEAWFLDPAKSMDQLRPLHRRTEGVEIAAVHHWKDCFMILTNDVEKNFRLIETPDTFPSLKNSTEIVRGNREVFLTGFDVFENYIVLQEREKGLPRIRVMEAGSRAQHFISFSEPTFSLSMIPEMEFESTTLRFAFSSPKTSKKIFDYDLKTRERVLKKDTVIGGGFASENYVTERIFVKSHDGVEVPVSLLYRKDLDRSKPAPVLLYGYGSYGTSIPAGMGTSRLSLVDRGFIYAIAHIRGGSDLGRWWYEDGKFLKKKNTFFDFIAAAQALVERKYTHKGMISIMGGSAGGMLVGAAMNMAPELFSCVVGDVPFVDVINTMLDDSLMLTVTEYDEWGDPNQKEFFEYMLSYSPYDNLKRGEYPHVFLSAGWNDPRVTYWEPAKFVARLRECRLDSRLTLLHTNMGAGHGGASGRFGFLEELAMQYAFIVLCSNKSL